MARINLIFAILTTFSCLSQKPEAIVLGTQYTLYSEQLHQERKINVRLPDNFSDSVAYPVIYLLDGSLNEDFIPFCGLAFNAAYPWINLLPPGIIVGIENVDRRHDFTFPTTVAKDREQYPTTGHSEEFIAFMEKELIPWVNAHYQTRERTIVGQSLGGLVATEMLFKNTDLFDQYILISPSLWWDNESLLKFAPIAKLDKQQIFICHGDEGELMEKPAEQLANLLKSQSATPKNICYCKIPGTSHASISIYAFQLAFERMDWYFGQKK